MSKLIVTIQDSWSQLQPREKLFLRAGVIVSVAALVYLTVLPLWDKHSTLSAQHSQLQADLQWLHQQQEVVSRLSNNCSVKLVSAGASRKILARLVRRNQLKLDSIQEASDSFSVKFSGSDANSMVRVAHEIACEGYLVKSLQIAKSADDAKLLVATLEVQLVAR